MKYRTLGQTGLHVSEIGFGGWAMGGNGRGNSYGWTSDDAAIAAVARAVELGCNFFDTADHFGFGHSEELLGVAVAELGLHTSEEIVIATTVGLNFTAGDLRSDFSSSYIRYAADQSLRRLARVWLDLYQLQQPTIAAMQDGGIFMVLDELKQQGKVRHWGVVVSDIAEAQAAIAAGAETVQLGYNVLRQEAARQVFPLAQTAGLGVIVNDALGGGLLTDKYAVDSTWVLGDVRNDIPRAEIACRVQAAEALRFLEGDAGERTLPQAMLRFVLDNAAVSSVLVGIKTAAQAEEDLAASDVPKIDLRERRLIDGLLFSE